MMCTCTNRTRVGRGAVGGDAVRDAGRCVGRGAVFRGSSGKDLEYERRVIEQLTRVSSQVYNLLYRTITAYLISLVIFY